MRSDLAALAMGQLALAGVGGLATHMPSPASHSCHGGAATIVGTDTGGGSDVLEVLVTVGGERHRAALGDQVSPRPGNDDVDLGWDPRQDQASGGYDLRLGGRHGTSLRLAAPGWTNVAVGEGRDVVVGRLLVGMYGSPGPDHLVGAEADDYSMYGAGGAEVLRE